MPPPGAKLQPRASRAESSGRAPSPRLSRDFTGEESLTPLGTGRGGWLKGHHLPQGVSALAGCRAPSGRPGHPCRPGLCALHYQTLRGESLEPKEKDHSSLTLICVHVVFFCPPRGMWDRVPCIRCAES